MLKIISIPKIKLIMNLFIGLTLVLSLTMIVSQSYELIFEADDIDIIRVQFPWYNPLSPVTVMFDTNILKENPSLLENINLKVLIYDLIRRTTFLLLLLLILVQIKKMLIAIRRQSFFELKNILIIRNLSILVGVWVGGNFILYQVLPLFIPVDLITEAINFVTMKDSLYANLMIAIDFKMLFVAIILFVVSILFKEGLQLKEQTDLTI